MFETGVCWIKKKVEFDVSFNYENYFKISDLNFEIFPIDLRDDFPFCFKNRVCKGKYIFYDTSNILEQLNAKK